MILPEICESVDTDAGSNIYKLRRNEVEENEFYGGIQLLAE